MTRILNTTDARICSPVIVFIFLNFLTKTGARAFEEADEALGRGFEYSDD